MCTDHARVATYGQLTTKLSRRELEARVREGALVLLRRGVYAESLTCSPVRTAAMHGGGLACTTAARHRGLWVLSTEDTVHVWLGGHGRSRPHEPCSCIEHWDDPTSTGAFGIPAVPRMLRQILLCRGIEEFFVTLESALHQRKITRAGMAWLRTHCGGEARDAIEFARTDAESGLESLLRWRFRGSGLRIRSQISIVSVGRVDFLIGDRLIVEVDGMPNHAGPPQRHRDLIRDAHAAAWGYSTLRFDYAMVVHNWATVELAILAHVDRGLHLVPAR